MPAAAETFGQRLKRLREERSLTVAELAEAAGTVRQYVYELEADRKAVSLEMARRLAAALGQRLRVWE